MAFVVLIDPIGEPVQRVSLRLKQRIQFQIDGMLHRDNSRDFFNAAAVRQRPAIDGLKGAERLHE